MDRSSFKLGETVRGRLRLNLKGPTQARGIRMNVGTYQITGLDRRRSVIYLACKEISNQKREYENGEEFDFAIPLPANMLSFWKTIWNRNLVTFFGKDLFFINAVLDIPFGLDIASDKDIDVKK